VNEFIKKNTFINTIKNNKNNNVLLDIKYFIISFTLCKMLNVKTYQFKKDIWLHIWFHLSFYKVSINTLWISLQLGYRTLVLTFKSHSNISFGLKYFSKEIHADNKQISCKIKCSRQWQFFTLKKQHLYDFDHFISINKMQTNSQTQQKKIFELKSFPMSD
jgi:hypothetical protein